MQNDEDLKKDIKNRIVMINDDLKHNLTSLSLDDDMEESEIKMIRELSSMAIEYQQSLDALKIGLTSYETEVEDSIELADQKISLKVKKQDAVSELNVETGMITFKTKLFLVDTDNFKLTANSCYVNGAVYASTGKLGKWNFYGNTLSGDASTIMSGGTVEAKTATCKYVQSDYYDLNPEYESNYHEVNWSNTLWEVGETNVRKTMFTGNVCSNGSIHFLTDLTANNDFYCTRLRLVKDGSYTNDCIIYCTEIVTDTKTWSDIRLKKDIRKIRTDDCRMLEELEPVTFILKKNGRIGTGLIAQDVKTAAEKYDIHSIVNEKDGFYAVSYEQIIPLMLKQIKENAAKLERIKNGKGSL